MSYEIKFEPSEDPWDFSTTLRIIIDGEVVATHWDGGEPEDQSFGRDWSWVGTELKRAYEQGLKDGANE